MPIVPRAAPDKPGMPVLGYFVVVGSILTALLFAADAYMPRPDKPTFANNFDGLPAEYKGEPDTRRSTPAPAIASIAPVAETTGSATPREEPAAAAPQPAQEAAKAKPQRKVMYKRQRQDDDDWFGGNNRREFAFGSPREPSWRDSWASGAFDRPRERVSRRASRQNNDFWSFR